MPKAFILFPVDRLSQNSNAEQHLTFLRKQRMLVTRSENASSAKEVAQHPVHDNSTCSKGFKLEARRVLQPAV